ncbi:MAG TPA: diacylglycerol kinase family protein [Egicoccus sp.]|nr:diacylglycerol kinase family protein [Egicoccus sp.]HSK23432.1 diacylglycerol kinase family protein [Egicoccus sp.]
MSDADGFVLLVNRAAGSSEDAVIDQVALLLRTAGHEVEIRACGHPDDVDDVVATVGDRTLVVCGGDGSLHLAVGRLRSAGRLDVAVGLIPLGTGNDFARAVGIPLDDAGAAVEHLLASDPRPMDLLVGGDDRACVNALHLGLGATAAARADAMKDSLDDLAYPLGAILAGLTAGGTQMRVEVDGEVVADGQTLLVAVCNGTGFGGGARIAPDADPADGLLDVVVAQATGPLARAAFGLALQRGTHLEREDVHLARGRRVVIEGEDLRDDVDGELGEPGAATPAWQVDAGAWRFAG